MDRSALDAAVARRQGGQPGGVGGGERERPVGPVLARPPRPAVTCRRAAGRRWSRPTAPVRRCRRRRRPRPARARRVRGWRRTGRRRRRAAVELTEQERAQRTAPWRRRRPRRRRAGRRQPDGEPAPERPVRRPARAGGTHAGGLQDVAGTADGVDHRLPAGVDLLAQVADVELDDVGLAAEVVVPDPVEDLRLAQHPARVAHEEPQQLELGRGQLDPVAAAVYLVRVLVQGQVADGQPGRAGVPAGAGPAQQPAQPGQHLLQAERLGDVVVAAGGDAGDPVLDSIPGGQEQHAHVRVGRPHAAQHLQPVEVREHDVEDDRVRTELAGDPDGVESGVHDLHDPALPPQHAAEDLGQAALVVHDEDPRGLPVRADQPGLPSGGGRLVGRHRASMPGTGAGIL